MPIAAWLLLIPALAVVGCRGKKPVEVPVPVIDVSTPPPPPPTPNPPPADPAPTGGLSAADRATLETRIHFDYDRWDLTETARRILAAKAEILVARTSITIRIEGHADERGSDEYNLVLSSKRAAEAKRFLTTQGVEGGRIEVIGYGEEQPLQNGTTEAAYAANRRAEFRMTGGLPMARR